MTSIQHILTRSTDFFNSLLQSIVTKQSTMADLTQAIEVFVRKLGQDILTEVLEQADEALYETVKPRHAYQVKEKRRARTLVTTFGEITFHRRYYRDVQTNAYTYLLDDWCQLPPYSRIDVSCQAQIADYAKDYSYAKAVKLATPASLSRQSAKQILDRIGVLPNTAAPLPEPRKEITHVYVEADEAHIAIQKDRNRQLRQAYVYESKKAVGKNRRELTEKRVFTGYGNLWPELEAYLYSIYGEPQVTILGDGAAWIQGGTAYIPYSSCVMDGFHAMKYLRNIAGNGAMRPLYEAILADDPAQFCREVAKKKRYSPQRKTGIAKGKQYVLNHWQSIRQWLQHPETYSSSTEGHVSHLLAARLSSRGMGWSKKGAAQVARLRTFKENGGNVQNYVIEHLVKKPAVMPAVEPQALARQSQHHRLFYGTYDANHCFALPGSEEALHGSWMKDIKNGGYHHIS